MEMPTVSVAGAVLSWHADCKATPTQEPCVCAAHLTVGWRYATPLLCDSFGLHWSQASVAVPVRRLAGNLS
jgi:hypothetical protein